MDLDLLPPDPFSFASALAVGATRQQLRTAVRKGTLFSPTRGWYARCGRSVPAAERWEATREDHLARLAVALHTHPGAAASHDSAALLHGLPIVVAPTAEVQIVQVDGFPTSRRQPGLVVHHADSTPTPTAVVAGLRTTLIPRTIADVVRTRRVPHALATLDQSIRQGLVTLDEVESELREQQRWVGKTRAKETLALVDPRRESWGESHSYGVIAQRGFPRPLPQVEIFDANFTFVARTDALLDHELAFFELDGEAKYFLDPTPAETTEETVTRHLLTEQRRHQAIEELGLVGARWTPELAMHAPEEVSARLQDAIRRARGNTFTGWVRWEGRYRKLPLVPR